MSLKELDIRGLIDLVYDDKNRITVNVNANNLIWGANTVTTIIKQQIDLSIRIIYEYNPDIAHLLEQAASIEELKNEVSMLASSLQAYYKSNRKEQTAEKIKKCLEWIKIAIELGICAAPIVKTLYNAVAQEIGMPLLP